MREYIDIAATLLESPQPPEIVYHGSKTPAIKDFEYREGTRAVLFNEVKVKANGFYFSLTANDATEYGRYVGEYRIQCRNPLIYDGLDIRRDQKRCADLRYILAALYDATDDPDIVSYNGMLDVRDLHPDDLTSETSDWFLEYVRHNWTGRDNGLDWEVLDNPEVVKRMRERGYDSTTVYEPDHKDVKYSWFVLTPQQIKYVGPYDPNGGDDDWDWED